MAIYIHPDSNDNGRLCNRSVRTYFVPLVGLVVLVLALVFTGTHASAQETNPDTHADLGDAPDSSNHYGLANPAYPSVPGKFPTVWEGTPAEDPSGPMHADPSVVWLGERVTSEQDADLLPDVDGITNLLDNGADANSVDMDQADDGWLNQEHAIFRHCQETTLRVRVSKAATANTGRFFLNVYFDGNRNGYWRERQRCETDNPGETVGSADQAHEWIVQNFVIDTSTITGHADIAVPTVQVLNAKPDAPAWVRFMLSEEPVRELAPFEHDGRGPHHPGHFKMGETEDYLHRPRQEGEPGDISLDKTYNLPPSTPLGVGTVFSYSVYIAHNDGTAPAFVKMEDLLPPEVRLVRGPFVAETHPHASPLTAVFDSSTGPSGAVRWQGHLSPGASIRIDFGVEIRRCPPQDNPTIRNVTRAQREGGALLEAEAVFEMKCERPNRPPQIELKKRFFVNGMVPDSTQTGDEPEYPILPGYQGVYELELSSNDDISHTVVVTDPLPAGVVGVQVAAGHGVIHLSDDGSVVKWEVRVGPHNRPVRARIRVKLTDRFHCEDRLPNVAYWRSEDAAGEVHAGRSNRIWIRHICRDLGDAPDSSNHFSVGMTAYPGGTAARFPTVFNVAPPERGPMHLFAKPMHLGPRVTGEIEADLGPDVDATNNIIPRANVPDKDERDDGLIWEKFKLEHCQIVRFPLLVSLDAALLAAIPDDEEAFGYINAWIDSNRDGDWADVRECPTASGAARPAWEHIVIDQRIDLRALGPGLHTVLVTTTGPVFWNPESVARPAWLRISLSERPSNKVLDCGAGACHVGDGRGHETPFRFGETEDYLIRPVRPDQPQEGADPAVYKRGRLTPRYDPATDTTLWVAQWAVDFRNAGYATANNTVLVDRLEGPQTLQTYSTSPVSPTVSGSELTYSLGTLAPGRHGFVGIRATLPANTPPGTVITNTATISASNDANTINNSAIVTLTVPLLPPVITYPTPGTTCTGTLAVVGQAQPGVVVDLYIDGSLAGTISPDAAGNWTFNTVLSDGIHEIYAVARYAGRTSSPSPTVRVIVDSSLFWNPLSLRFTDAAGHTIIPHDGSGRTDATGWNVFLRRGTVYTVSVEICCDDPNALVTLELGNFATITLTDADGDGVYTATFTTPSSGPIQGTIRLCVICNLIKKCSDGQVTIDPEGTVFNVLTGDPVAGATVACLQSQVSSAEGEIIFNLWPAADFDQINPQTTQDDGYFSFFTPPSTYRLQVSAPGFQNYVSRDLAVVDEPVHFDPPLTPVIDEEAGYTVVVGPDGFEPQVLEVPAGAVIEWVNQDSAVHATVSQIPAVQFDPVAAELKSSDGWDSGLLYGGDRYKRQLTTLGTYTYYDSENPTHTGTILVVEEVENPPSGTMIYLPAIRRE